MSTTYHPFKIALTDGQKKKLQKAYVTKTAVNLKVKPDQIGRGVELLLTETQIARLKKRSAAGKGMVIKLSQTQIQSTSVGKSVGKGMQTQPPPPPRKRRSPPIPPPKGKGMQIQPQPFYGTWEDYHRLRKKLKFEDKPLSNIDLKKWCNFLRIPIKGIFSRNEKKPCFILHALSTWMILEVWELTGYVVGLMLVLMNISIHLGFHHLWNGKKKCQCTG